MILEFGEYEGYLGHFGISKGKGGGGCKMFMPAVVGYGFFLESPKA